MYSLSKPMFFLLAASLPLWASPQTLLGQEQTKPPSDKKIIAYQILEIRENPWGTSGNVIGGTIADPQQTKGDTEINYYFLPDRLVVGVNRQYSGDPKALPAKARKALEKQLNEPYQREFSLYYRREKELHHDLEEILSELLGLRNVRRKIQEKLPGPLSLEGIEEQIAKIKRQHFALRVDIAGLQARRKAILKQMKTASPSDIAKKRLQEAKNRYALLKQLVQRIGTLSKAGARGGDEDKYTKAQLDLSKAEQELAEMTSALEQPANLEQLNHLLQQTEFDLTAAEARLAVLEETLQQINQKDLQDQICNYGLRNFQLKRLEKRAETIQKSLDDLARKKSELRPVWIRELQPPKFAPKGGEIDPYSIGIMGDGMF